MLVVICTLLGMGLMCCCCCCCCCCGFLVIGGRGCDRSVMVGVLIEQGDGWEAGRNEYSVECKHSN